MVLEEDEMVILKTSREMIAAMCGAMLIEKEVVKNLWIFWV